MSKIQALLDAMPLPEGEPFPGKTYIADGWKYRDIPKLSPQMWDYFTQILGEENFVCLTISEYFHDDELVAKRGQILISPVGMENLARHIAPKN